MKKKRRLSRSDVWWVSIVVLLVLLQFWWIPGDNGSAADSYSNSVDGKLGAYRVLSALFPEVKREAGRLIPDQRSVLMIVGPDRYPSEQEQTALSRFMTDGGCLIFAPGYSDSQTEFSSLSISTSPRPEPSPDTVGSTSVATLSGSVLPAGGTDRAGDPENEEQRMTSSGAAPEDVSGEAGSVTNSEVPEVSGDTGVIEKTSTDKSGGMAGAAGSAGAVANVPMGGRLRGPLTATSPLIEGSVRFFSNAIVNTSDAGWETLVADEAGCGQVAVRAYGRGCLVVSASPDLFSNRSLLRPENCRLVVRIVERAMRPQGSVEVASVEFLPVVISEYLNASDSYRSVGVLLSPSLRQVTLQILLVGVLGIWLAFYRFGPARAAATRARRMLSESAEAVGDLQYQLHDGSTVVASYLDYVSHQLRRRYGRPLTLEESDALAARSGLPVEEIRLELAEIQRLSEEESVAPAAAAHAVRWLSRLQQRVSGIRSRVKNSMSGKSESGLR